MTAKNNNTALNSPAPAGIVATTLLLGLCLAPARAADPPAADDGPATEPVDVQVFQAARPVRAPDESAYPYDEKRHGREGWVLLNMMIDPKGHPHEVTVLDSSGNTALEKAAVSAALHKIGYQAAKIGSTPVDSSLTFNVAFYLNGGARGATPEFITAYLDAMKALDTGDKAQADAQFAKLRVSNLYEDGFRRYAQYAYDRKWGTDAQQLQDLQRAVAGDRLGRYLGKDMFAAVLVATFALELKLKDYGSALGTWKALKPVAPAALRSDLQHMADQLIALRDSGETVTTPASIDAVRMSWNGRLFRNRFFLAVNSGAVDEIKLRCQKKYLFFKYQRDVQYTVSPTVGDCDIEVIGDPGTTFELRQP